MTGVGRSSPLSLPSPSDTVTAACACVCVCGAAATTDAECLRFLFVFAVVVVVVVVGVAAGATIDMFGRCCLAAVPSSDLRNADGGAGAAGGAAVTAGDTASLSSSLSLPLPVWSAPSSAGADHLVAGVGAAAAAVFSFCFVARIASSCRRRSFTATRSSFRRSASASDAAIIDARSRSAAVCGTGGAAAGFGFFGLA